MTATEIIYSLEIGKAITDKTFDKDVKLSLYGISTRNGAPVTFENCTFQANFDFTNLKNNIAVNFINCHFEKGLQRFIDLKVFRIKFDNCSFYNLAIVDSEIINLYFENCSSIGNEAIQLRHIKSSTIEINWEDESQKASFEIWCPDTNYINIQSRNNLQSLAILDVKSVLVEGTVNRFFIPARKFENISIQPFYPESVNGRVDVYDCISEIRMINHSFSGTLKIKDIEIGDLFFSNIESSEGIVSLLNLNIKVAEFLDVNFNSFYWNQINFSGLLRIERCDFSNLKIANVKWPKGNKVSSSHIDLSKKRIRRSNLIKALQFERETYRQLKAASIANHNGIEALGFYKNEMRLFWKEIRITGGISFWDRILVFLNRWVSDFGQSWALPLLWLFLFHTLIYFSIIGFNFTMNFEAFRDGAGQYFELLNPVHKTPGYIKGFNVGLELLLRILDGFFIYHFIRATRKFGKV